MDCFFHIRMVCTRRIGLGSTCFFLYDLLVQIPSTVRSCLLPYRGNVLPWTSLMGSLCRGRCDTLGVDLCTSQWEFVGVGVVMSHG